MLKVLMLYLVGDTLKFKISLCAGCHYMLVGTSISMQQEGPQLQEAWEGQLKAWHRVGTCESKQLLSNLNHSM